MNGILNALSANDVLKLKQLSGLSRLYIFGHCDKGSDILSDNNNLNVHYAHLAYIIAACVNRNNIAGLRIAIFGCHGASSSWPGFNDSFAAKLHYQLACYGITTIDLTAYTDSKAIRMSGDTFQIHKYSKTDKPILDSLIQRKREALLKAKQRFKQKIKRSLSTLTPG